MAGHKHAALMAEYAKDAAETDKPWYMWQIFVEHHGWIPVIGCPDWDSSFQFRRKPRTLTIGRVEIEAPLRRAEVGQKVHAAGAAGNLLVMEFVDTHANYDALNNGRLFATPEAAKAAYDAITALLTGKDAA